MPVSVSIKWQKEVFQDVEIDTDQPPLVFKGQLFALTGVPPDRQKILVKGGLLQDYGDWSKYSIKAGQRIMLMGSLDSAPVAPAKAPVFLEDLPEEDRSGAVSKDSTAGLENLGNTCYMNSTLQCLYAVPELKSSLLEFSPSTEANRDTSLSLTLAMKNLFRELGASLRPVEPNVFLMALRTKFPQFAQTGQNGHFMQQDAEECWTQIVFALKQSLKDPASPTTSVVDRLFGIQLTSILSCEESKETSTEMERVFSLKCHITSDVNQLHEGLSRGFKESLEKESPSLGRSAVFSKHSLISELPKFLTVQFVRFFWKRESQQKAKILRKVGYPLVLDVYEFCSEALRQKLDANRKILKQRDDEKAGIGSSASSGSAVKTDAAAEEMQDSMSEDAGSVEGQTGFFEVVSVLTHKGRSADSGHYVAWVKQENGRWVEFDDDNPVSRKEEDITNLSGGGDWHMAYILVYKARLV